jgi:serine/threonine protein phosphatase PrpC
MSVKLVVVYQQRALRMSSASERSNLWMQLERDIKQYLLSVEHVLYQKLKHQKRDVGGSTFVGVALMPRVRRLAMMNVGDSYLFVEGPHYQYGTWEHKPGHDQERKRIYDSKGFVHKSRVNGVLALSRSFGMFRSPFPFVCKHLFGVRRYSSETCRINNA